MDAQERAALSTDLAAAKDGDRKAARRAFQALWEPLRRFAWRSLKDDTLADEAAQRSLVRLFGQLQRYDEERDALSWAFALCVFEVRSLVRDEQRAQKRSQPLNDTLTNTSGPSHDTPAQTALDGMQQQDKWRSLDMAMQSLSAADQAAIALLLDDADPEQPLSARVRKQRQRAVARLKSAWRTLYGT